MDTADQHPERAHYAQEEIILHVLEVLRALHSVGHRIVILSDRTERLGESTKDHFKDGTIPYHEIFWRAEGDERSEEIVKRDLFTLAALPSANVLAVFDDSPPLLDYMRKQGVACVDVCATNLA